MGKKSTLGQKKKDDISISTKLGSYVLLECRTPYQQTFRRSGFICSFLALIYVFFSLSIQTGRTLPLFVIPCF